MELSNITRVVAPPLVPELRVPGLPEGDSLDSFRVRYQSLIGAGVPYWAVAWPGGQALARYLLDQPQTVNGCDVIDLGCGNGLVASAAMRAGADRAVAIDNDPIALAAAKESARLNAVAVETHLDSLETLSISSGTVICAADLWYEPVIARRATQALTRLAHDAARILIADPGRPGRPRNGTNELACYTVPASQEFERAGTVETRVFNFAPNDILAAHPPHADDARGNDPGKGRE